MLAIVMTKLSININKIALIRNSRGGNNPDIYKIARELEDFGADGITVHPRPDERHIRYADVYALKEMLRTELNVEGNPTEDFMRMVLEVKPAQVTLVPDAPDALTSSAGWDTIHHRFFLTEICSRLRDAGIRSSIFVDTDLDMIAGAAQIGTDRIELYTEAYASNYQADPIAAIAPYKLAAKKAAALGLGINAGHDLNLDNLRYLHQELPGLNEVSIGHALVCDALYVGLKNVVRMYQRELRG